MPIDFLKYCSEVKQSSTQAHIYMTVFVRIMAFEMKTGFHILRNGKLKGCKLPL
jgi:hypothetical protein